jgi:nicotinamide mononucleotide transporter
VIDEFSAQFVAGLRAATPAETLAVILGFAYSLLAVRRNRLCWFAGGASSAILALLFARRQLPMQAVLQAYYVAMSIYGFWNWSREVDAGRRRVTVWPLRAHVAAWLVIGALSAASAHWLVAESSAWPLLDSAVAWASVLATWFVARVKLENWLYWIVTDAVLVFLSAAQGLSFVAVLYLGFLCIAVVGFRTWLRAFRTEAARI